jgi:ankyrin repeat protein
LQLYCFDLSGKIEKLQFFFPINNNYSIKVNIIMTADITTPFDNTVNYTMVITEFAYLASRGRLTVEMVKEANINQLQQSRCAGFTTLYWASYSCPVEVVQALLDRGLDINETSGRVVHTPLIGAAYQGTRWDTVLLLLNAGAEVQIYNIQNKNALYFASEFGAPREIILALLDAGSDASIKAVEGLTAADIARKNEHYDVANLIEGYSYQTKSANLFV